MIRDDDIDETMRLVLMEYPRASFAEVVRACRKADRVPTLTEWKYSYCRYRSFDGRTTPTHDVETGQRIGVAR